MSHANMDPDETVRVLLQIYYVQRDVEEWHRNAALLTTALRALSQEQAQRLAEEIWPLYDHERVEWFLGQLNTTIPGALAHLQPNFIARGRFYPGWLYLGAEASTTEQLIHLIDHPSQQSRHNLLLMCLAWIGDALVQAPFHAWAQTSPMWRSELHSPLEAIPLEAGWELTSEGGRRDLYQHESFELLPVNTLQVAPSATVVVTSTSHEGQCRWCQRPLISALEFDLRDPRCAAVIGVGSRLRVAECQWCSLHATIFTDIDLEGRSDWSEANGPRPAILDRIPDDGMTSVVVSHQLALGAPRRTPFEAVGRFQLDETGISQLGGCPEWLQYVAYPLCPTCQRHMKCIAQLAWDEVEAFAEGMTYAFLCVDCGKAATAYQQT